MAEPRHVTVAVLALDHYTLQFFYLFALIPGPSPGRNLARRSSFLVDRLCVVERAGLQELAPRLGL
jgi:hypothetical protein